MRSFSVTEIGVAHTPYRDRYDAPCQPQVQGGAEGRIEILPPYRACLEDLAGFERVWILYIFDRNEGWRARVKPPRGDKKRGLFATRGPHRPSPVGMTAARLLEVLPDALLCAELDLLDGTPIIDIKPYIPDVDAHPGARAGWLEELS